MNDETPADKPTPERIAIIADELAGEGYSPSQITNKLIRDRLGSGSFSTIGPALKAWKEAKAAKAANVTPVNLPDEVLRLAHAHTTTLWARATQAAEATFAMERQAQAQKLAEAEARVTEALQDADEAATAVKAVTAQLDEQRTIAASTHDQLLLTKREEELLRHQLEEERARTKRLEGELEKQRKVATSLEQQLQQANLHLEQSRAKIEWQAEAITKAEQRLESTQDEIAAEKQHSAALEAQLRTANEQCDALRQDTLRTEDKLRGELERAAKAEARASELANGQENFRKEIDRLRAQNETLAKALATFPRNAA